MPLMIACIVLAIGLLISVGLSRHARINTKTRCGRASTGSSRAPAGIRPHRRFSAVLFGMQGLFIASEHIDRREFQRYYGNLRAQLRCRARGTHAPRGRTRKAAFVAAVRRDRASMRRVSGFCDPSGKRRRRAFHHRIYRAPGQQSERLRPRCRQAAVQPGVIPRRARYGPDQPDAAISTGPDAARRKRPGVARADISLRRAIDVDRRTS